LPLKQIASGASTTISNGGSIAGDFTVSNNKSDIPPICATIGEPTVIYVNTEGFGDHYIENSAVTALTNTNP